MGLVLHSVADDLSRTGPRRRSEAAIALFVRWGPAREREVLAQWNVKWQSFSLVGGGREAGETFRECCLREVEEELHLRSEVDFRIAAEPLAPGCDYRARSKSAGVETDYVFEVFPASLATLAAATLVGRDALNRWLSEGEVRQGITSNGAPIADQVVRILQLYPA
jgi:8-oxo-dGTP pyrophosphatase MutT (NUDIX family)